MTTFADLFSSLKDELAARYRSPVWGAAFIALIAYHWKIIVFFFTEKPSAADAIAFIEAHASGRSIVTAIAIALCYVIVFPWVELLIARVASCGKRHRNDFHTKERQQEIGQRKLIAQEQAQLIEIKRKNMSNQSILTDTELVKDYQKILSGENFGRWLNDLQKGIVNSSLSNTIFNYLNKVDTVEGKFNNPEVESAHANFVSELSTLQSALSNGDNDSRRPDLKEFATKVNDSYKVYRQKAREILGV